STPGGTAKPSTPAAPATYPAWNSPSQPDRRMASRVIVAPRRRPDGHDRPFPVRVVHEVVRRRRERGPHDRRAMAERVPVGVVDGVLVQAGQRTVVSDVEPVGGAVGPEGGEGAAGVVGEGVPEIGGAFAVPVPLAAVARIGGV